jgi:hypothetical protein
MDVDTTILICMAFVMGMAPAITITWVIIAKYAMEVFSTADTQALTEKANPALVYGTYSQPAVQASPSVIPTTTPAVCPATVSVAKA